MMLQFLSLGVVLIVAIEDDSHPDSNKANTLWGTCYQFDTEQQPQIIQSIENQLLSFNDLGLESNQCCIWFEDENYARTALNYDTNVVQNNCDNNQHVQHYSPNSNTNDLIQCNNQEILLSDSSSKHLCNGVCLYNEGGSCIGMPQSQQLPLSLSNSNVSPLIPSMFAISGIIIAFITASSLIYCFAVKYSKWTVKQSNNETEEVIHDVLDEIAKYTIGNDSDDEILGGYADWDNDDESGGNISTSTDDDEKELGMEILRVVSHSTFPGFAGTNFDDSQHPNPSVDDLELHNNESSIDSSEEDDIELANDLFAAKQSLTLNPSNTYYHTNLNKNAKLDSIKEIVYNKKITKITPKKPLLSDCDQQHHSSFSDIDCKMSSENIMSNSDLP